MATKNASPATIRRCCELFIDAQASGRTISAIAKILEDETGRRHTRVEVYRLFERAKRDGLLLILPRPDGILERELAERFGMVGEPLPIQVVASRIESASEAVVSCAAAGVVELIQQVARAKGAETPVGIGFVGGRTIMRFAQLLAARLTAEPRLPKLAMHAVCSGFDPLNPETAPGTFLGYFTELTTDVELVGLFAPPAVEMSRFEKALNDRIVQKSFDRRPGIDIVVTSLALLADPHNILSDLAGLMGDDPQYLKDLGVIGDVGYKPFGEKGKIDLTRGHGAITLFDIPALHELARTKNKHVILLAGPCPACQRTRHEALRPLLEVPELKVWSKLYLDTTTAQRLLETSAV